MRPHQPTTVIRGCAKPPQNRCASAWPRSATRPKRPAGARPAGTPWQIRDRLTRRPARLTRRAEREVPVVVPRIEDALHLGAFKEGVVRPDLGDRRRVVDDHFVGSRKRPVAGRGIGDRGTPAELGAGAGLTASDVLAFSPDGKLLAASLLTGGVRVFDPRSGRVLRTLADPGNETVSLAFAPTGDLLAGGTLDGTVELWDPFTGKRLAQPLLADSSAISDIAFDPSGRRFATTGLHDATVKVWFTGSLEQEGPRLAADPKATAAAAFRPGQQGLLVVDDLGGAFTWPMSLASWEQRACSLAGRNLTRAEWAQFVSGPRYASVCR